MKMYVSVCPYKYNLKVCDTYTVTNTKGLILDQKFRTVANFNNGSVSNELIVVVSLQKKKNNNNRSATIIQLCTVAHMQTKLPMLKVDILYVIL